MKLVKVGVLKSTNTKEPGTPEEWGFCGPHRRGKAKGIGLLTVKAVGRESRNDKRKLN